MNLVSGEYMTSYDYYLVPAGNGRYNWFGKLYNQLLINYEGQNVQCEVCSEWHLANNGKTMVFTLIPGIKFHSGQEMTSEDVKYSIMMIIGEVDGLASIRVGSLKEFVESVEAPSKYEVRLNLTKAASSYVAKLLAVSVAVLYRAGTTRDDLKKAPAGSGPYVLTKDSIQQATLDATRNPNYFKPGLPYIDTVRSTVVIDATTRWAAVLTHRAERMDGQTRPPAQFRPQLEKLVAEGKMTSYKYLGGNYLIGPWLANTKPPFNNLKLRQAVNLAVDRRDYGLMMDFPGGVILGAFLMYREADGAYGRPESQIWNVLPGWGTGAKKQQEIEQAKQLVKDAGYPNGLDFTIMAYTNISESELYQQQLAKIGLRATIEVVARDSQLARLLTQDYMLAQNGYQMGVGAPEEVVGQYWVTGASRSPTGYSNPEVDKLFVQMVEESDPAKKVALFKQIAETILLKDVAWPEMPDGIFELLHWNRLQGVGYGMSVHPTASSGLMRGDRLWLKD